MLACSRSSNVHIFDGQSLFSHILWSRIECLFSCARRRVCGPGWYVVRSNSRGFLDFFSTGIDSCGVDNVRIGAFNAFSREATLKLGLRPPAIFNVVCEYFPLDFRRCVGNSDDLRLLVPEHQTVALVGVCRTVLGIGSSKFLPLGVLLTVVARIHSFFLLRPSAFRSCGFGRCSMRNDTFLRP